LPFAAAVFVWTPLRHTGRMNEKPELRKKAEVLRRQLVRPGFAAQLTGYAESLALERGATVSGYSAFRDEADPGELLLALAERGHPLCLPVIAGKGQPLRFHRWQPSDVLRVHAFGVREPLVDAEIVAPSVLLVPLLAFDAGGYRLGYGGGYYDRTLHALRRQSPILAVGIAYAGQEVAVLPHGPHDEKLDAVLTEDGLRSFA
jgi:5-formyltetrahydrofolate cyclo-ligase